MTAVLTVGQEGGSCYAGPLNLFFLGAGHLIPLFEALMIARRDPTRDAVRWPLMGGAFWGDGFFWLRL